MADSNWEEDKGEFCVPGSNISGGKMFWLCDLCWERNCSCRGCKDFFECCEDEDCAFFFEIMTA